MMREFMKMVEGEELALEPLNEAVGQQYMLAIHDLASGQWDVKFFPDRAGAYQAWTEWSGRHSRKGDAYIGPVEIKKHASPKDRPSDGQ